MSNIINKCAVISSFLLLIWIDANAQDELRLWADGPLSWDDFHGKEILLSEHNSALIYLVSYEVEKLHFSDTIVYKYVTQCGMKPHLSWAKDYFKNDKLLKYHQIQFDIVEKFSRQLENDLNSSNGSGYLYSITNETDLGLDYEIRLFESESMLGVNSEVVNDKFDEVQEFLQQNPRKKYPAFTDRDWGMGMNIGMGFTHFGGDISKYYSSRLNFLFGFDFYYKKTVLFLNGGLSLGKLHNSFEAKGKSWPTGLKSGIALIDISLGQVLVDSHKHKISPFAGLGILEFSASNSEGDEYEDHKILDIGFLIGINYEYKIKKIINLASNGFYGAKNNRAEHNIRTRLYYTNHDFGVFKGWILNWSVSYELFGKGIQIVR